MRNHRAFKKSIALLAVLVAGATLAACGSDDDTSSGSDTSSSTKASSEPVTLRLGYFPNVTHAPALVGSRAASSRRTSATT